jgi:hypothetical protein
MDMAVTPALAGLASLQIVSGLQSGNRLDIHNAGDCSEPVPENSQSL